MVNDCIFIMLLTVSSVWVTVWTAYKVITDEEIFGRLILFILYHILFPFCLMLVYISYKIYEKGNLLL